jgi:hypothetical protein
LDTYPVKVSIAIGPGFPRMTPAETGDAFKALVKAFGKLLLVDNPPAGHVCSGSHGLSTVHLIYRDSHLVDEESRDRGGPAGGILVEEHLFDAGLEQSEPGNN